MKGDDPSQPASSSSVRPSPSLLRSAVQRSASGVSAGAGTSDPRIVSPGQAAGRASPRSNDGQAEGAARAVDRAAGEPEGRDGRGQPAAPFPVAEDEVEKLRKAIDQKMLQNQQRARAAQPTSPGGRRQVSPIKEETGSATPSPTLEASFNSPGAPTASTESTDSAKTIRGSVPATPGQMPLRTPSYPFPYVPGTPHIWSEAFHQPFTTLSPTTPVTQPAQGEMRERVASDTSTPVGSAGTFMPGAVSGAPDDPRFPTPNVYEIVLHLNLEPGLEAWWEVVTRTMAETFRANRATLSIPADPSDIENVPWGQKAAFGLSHPKEVPFPENVRKEASPPSAATKPFPQQGPAMISIDSPAAHARSSATRRPNLKSRHSFGGYEHHRNLPGEKPASNKPISRPRGPLRTASHSPQMSMRPDQGSAKDHPAPLKTRTPSENIFSESEFTSVGGDAPSEPYRAMFEMLRGLGREVDPLIDSSGINRVLERGKVVVLTREFTDVPAKRKDSHSDSAESSESNSVEPVRAEHPIQAVPKHGLPSRRSFNRYEEYEQYPTSPWAQSPAPSPAIRADEEENPFFSSTTADEESFNPAGSTQDYSKYDQVEAIGLEKSSTIVHIPLIHPLHSQTVRVLESDLREGKTSGAQLISSAKNNKGVDLTSGKVIERKAPIAILSLFSSTVPYPQVLINSLKSLGPHLATSLSIAQQYNAVHKQATGLGHRRFHSNHQVGLAPFASDSHEFGELMRLDLDQIDETNTGSITSPSDYSSRSARSPGGSITGTPSWEPAHSSYLGHSSRHTLGSTPGHDTTSSIDSYFDARTNVSARDHSPVRPANTKSPTKATKAHTMLHSFGADFSSTYQTLPASTSMMPRTPVQAHSQARTSKPESPEMLPPSGKLLRTIVDSLPVQIFSTSPGTGELTWANSKFLVYRGQDKGQVKDKPWDAIHPEDREDYMMDWNRSLRTGQQLQQKVRLRRFDDQYRWFYVRVAPLKDRKQNIVHWIGTNMDCHEQHIAETNSARQQETAASEAKYRALANSSPQIVFAATRKRGIIFCNTPWLTYSGQTEEEALGVGFMGYVHPDDLSKCRLPDFDHDAGFATNVPTSVPPDPSRASSASSIDTTETSKTVTSPAGMSSEGIQLPQAKLSKLASTGILKVSRDADGRPSYSTEVRLRSKDGNYRWHLVRVLLAEPVLRTTFEEETWYGTCTDINDHKLLEQTLKETMDAKSRFLSNMSHEIRTPLNGITGMVSFLIDSNLTGEQMEHVNIIRNSTEGLRDLINDILDLAKIEAGMITLSMNWLHVRSLIEDVNDVTSSLAIAKGLELNYIVEEDVPTILKGDRFRLRQVLLNVVGNAIKFTQKGEVFIRCKTYREFDTIIDPHSTVLQFDVIDTGSGFTDEEAKFLFKRFSQIDGSGSRQHGGTGLGLAISMQLVELHGGTMTASSVPGKGSTFTFTIRFELPTEDDHPANLAFRPESIGHAPPLSREHSSMSLPGTKTSKPLLSAVSTTEERPVPGPDAATQSPGGMGMSPSYSSGSSDPSMTTHATSVRSERSSASSYMIEQSVRSPHIKLQLPSEGNENDRKESPSALSQGSVDSNETARPSSSPAARPTSPIPQSLQAPPIYSILVICPWLHSREAAVKHIETTLPEGIPRQITADDSLLAVQKMIGGNDPVLFTHILVILPDAAEVIALLDQVFQSPTHKTTAVLVVSELMQKRTIIKDAPQYNYEQLQSSGRLRFIFKPLKPSKLANIFDPHRIRGSGKDRGHDSAQQVAITQKQVFSDLKKRLGNKGNRILLVEDNPTNQMVILKLLQKVAIDVDKAIDGVECLERIFSQPHGYYSMILCDLYMPNKDGYDTCKEIRKWEKKNNYSNIPVIALSANVLGDVYDKCVEAGFNSYVTKPVDFTVLSAIMTQVLDPEDPAKPLEFMRPRRK
ncbi:hypothetical protein BDY21DRAFT_396470 [Lineolata rhizophorae]|uniref:histidine kinase n=1 Tax=Lineolata rhizophorae TaxID=578093 RepID=A0A6A6NUI7_9PEZI|nr:hypothetical protein BDY21DRAFT_396470 [Lineolata rhizophorae]